VPSAGLHLVETTFRRGFKFLAGQNHIFDDCVLGEDEIQRTDTLVQASDLDGLRFRSRDTVTTIREMPLRPDWEPEHLRMVEEVGIRVNGASIRLGTRETLLGVLGQHRREHSADSQEDDCSAVSTRRPEWGRKFRSVQTIFQPTKRPTKHLT